MQKLIILFTFLLFLPVLVFCQTSLIDSNGLKIIKITHADSIVGYNDQVHQYQSLIGAVGIEHDGVVMTCDSAHLFQELNMVEAFSQVHISKANGSEAFSNYIKYTGNDNLAFMQGAVQIIDGKNTLQRRSLRIT